MRTLSRYFPATIVAAALIAALSSPARAVVMLDQSNLPATNSGVFPGLEGAGLGLAQTFTVGLSGILDSVLVQVQQGAPTKLRILGTTAGVPNGSANSPTVLAESTAITSVGDLHTFDLSPANLNVTIGDILAIELFGTLDSLGTPVSFWNSLVPGGYANGAAFFSFDFDAWLPNSNADSNFQTFVNTTAQAVVPEPATGALAMFGVGALVLRRRRTA